MELGHLHAPSWGLVLSNHSIDALSFAFGVAAAGLVAIPAGRAIARWLRRQHEARVDALVDALESGVRDSTG